MKQQGKGDASQNKKEKPKIKYEELLKKTIPMESQKKENADKQRKSVELRKKKEFGSTNMITDDQKIFSKELTESTKKKDNDSPTDEKNEQYDWKTQEE